MDSNELFANLSLEILAVIAGIGGLFIWFMRHYAQRYETLTDRQDEDHDILKKEVPRMTAAYETMAQSLEKNTEILTQLSAKLGHIEDDHHGIINENMAKIARLEQELQALTVKFNNSQMEVILCKKTVEIMQAYLKQHDKERYEELISITQRG